MWCGFGLLEKNVLRLFFIICGVSRVCVYMVRRCLSKYCTVFCDVCGVCGVLCARV